MLNSPKRLRVFRCPVFHFFPFSPFGLRVLRASLCQQSCQSCCKAALPSSRRRVPQFLFLVTPNKAGALGDAAWMCCLERNANIVLMHCYAPLFVNVSDLGAGRSMQWKSDLIGYDALNSHGSPSYYAQKIFSLHQGDEVLATEARNLSTFTWIQAGRTRNGLAQPAKTNEVKSLFYSATRDMAGGKIIVKIVNRSDASQDVQIQIERSQFRRRGRDGHGAESRKSRCDQVH